MKATTPLPSCIAPQGGVEESNVALQLAAALLVEEQWSDAHAAIAKHLTTIETAGDYGLIVRAHAILGQARVGLADATSATRELTRASEIWASHAALQWIRSLPTDESSQLSIQKATDAAAAAAAAAFPLAELWRERTLSPLPAFPHANDIEPFAPRPDEQLSIKERQTRQDRQARRNAHFLRYVNTIVYPWVTAERVALLLAVRAYEKVYLTPPVSPPYWRIAVAARIGLMWDSFVKEFRSNVPLRPIIAFGLDSAHRCGGGDEDLKLEKQVAWESMDACIALSRKYRIVSNYTIARKNWLADNFRHEQSRLDEFMPYPDLLPTDPIGITVPATLNVTK